MSQDSLDQLLLKVINQLKSLTLAVELIQRKHKESLTSRSYPSKDLAGAVPDEDKRIKFDPALVGICPHCICNYEFTEGIAGRYLVCHMCGKEIFHNIQVR